MWQNVLRRRTVPNSRSLCAPGKPLIRQVSSLAVFDSELQKHASVSAPPGAALLWYSCGPTVYDSAHAGHARAYMCQDIIRRIIENVLNQPLLYVMGMTDVDDKIIQRANTEGRSWRQHAAAHESMFLQDLQSLGIIPPHHIARVSEHIPTIIAHIEEIVAAGLTYSTPSGLYFDVHAFPGEYGKLRSHAADNPESLPSAAIGASDKRSAADFALWKACKEGEPSWDSPWGAGRPGWHIECSAMAGKVLGKKLHLHSGGVDLAFPHHTNEIAQTEASVLPPSSCCGASGAAALKDFKWVDAWMHCGHVHIEGRKMSKSLKNFISIQDMQEQLGSNAAEIFRVWCLQRHYRSSVTWDSASLEQAKVALQWWAAWSKRARAAELSAWSTQVHSGNMQSTETPAPLPWEEAEQELHSDCSSHVAEAQALLVRDFDTPAAVSQLRKAADAVDRYIQAQSSPNALLLLHVRSSVQSQWRALGVALPHCHEQQLLQQREHQDFAAPKGAVQSFDHTNAARVQLRELALASLASEEGGDHSLAKAVLGVCDVLRDKVLPPMALGATVSDDVRSNALAMQTWRELCGPKHCSAAVQPATQPKLASWQSSPHWRDLSVPPEDVYRVDTHLYRAFDGSIPTHHADGSPVSKSLSKKMRKAMERYRQAKNK